MHHKLLFMCLAKEHTNAKKQSHGLRNIATHTPTIVDVNVPFTSASTTKPAHKGMEQQAVRLQAPAKS